MEEKSDLDKLMEEMDIRMHTPILGWFYAHGWFGYNFLYLFRHPWKIIRGCYKELKWAWQRVFRGWDDRVSWGVDWYLCEMMPQWLKMVKENKHGVPVIFFQDEDYIDESYNVTDETMDKRNQECNDIIDQIADGFVAYKEMINKYPWDAGAEKRYNKGMELLKDYFFILSD